MTATLELRERFQVLGFDNFEELESRARTLGLNLEEQLTTLEERLSDPHVREQYASHIRFQRKLPGIISRVGIDSLENFNARAADMSRKYAVPTKHWLAYEVYEIAMRQKPGNHDEAIKVYSQLGIDVTKLINTGFAMIHRDSWQ